MYPVKRVLRSLSTNCSRSLSINCSLYSITKTVPSVSTDREIIIHIYNYTCATISKHIH